MTILYQGDYAGLDKTRRLLFCKVFVLLALLIIPAAVKFPGPAYASSKPICGCAIGEGKYCFVGRMEHVLEGYRDLHEQQQISMLEPSEQERVVRQTFVRKVFMAFSFGCVCGLVLCGVFWVLR